MQLKPTSSGDKELVFLKYKGIGAKSVIQREAAVKQATNSITSLDEYYREESSAVPNKQIDVDSSAASGVSEIIDIGELYEHLFKATKTCSSEKLPKEILYVHKVPSRQPVYSESPLPLLLQNDDGVPVLYDRLFRHQQEAIDSIKAGKHVCVSTPTASGKSLMFHIPILEAVLQHPSDITALYLFPTKALAHDQYQSILSLLSKVANQLFVKNKASVRLFVLDGDSPFSERDEAMKTAQIIITNPDLLHYTILPAHKRWSRFFRGLKYIVLDEVVLLSFPLLTGTDFDV